MVKIQVDVGSLEKEKTSRKNCFTIFEIAIRRRALVLLIFLCIQIPVIYTLYRPEDPRHWREKLASFANAASDVRQSIRFASRDPFGALVSSCPNRTCNTNRTGGIVGNSSTVTADNQAAIDKGGVMRQGSVANRRTVETTHGVGESEQGTSTKSTNTVAGERPQIATSAAFQSSVVQATENATEEILPLCPEEPPNLKGALDVSFEREPATFDTIAADNPLCENGGHFKPPFCVARNKVAIIIPFRNRDYHLRYFLQFMLPTLQRQQLEFQVYVINQSGVSKFNRAKLLNVGFVEALKDHDFGCFVFHDVDLILENDKCLYTCPFANPRHLSVGVDKFKYRLPYGAIFGGVTELTREQFQKVNGYSNSFWGWGGEDDDMSSRVRQSKMKVDRYGVEIARYKMISHNHEKGNEVNPERFKLIRETTQTMKNDGINSLKYKVISRELHSSYTNITVDVLAPT